MDKRNVIHSRGGRIGGRADTKPEDVDAIVEALRQDPRKHLVLHFHGGLVSKEDGMAIAAKLHDVYSPSATAGGYPVFFVWESGAWETIRNNLTELADEPVFKQLLRKILQYALEQLGVGDPSGTGRSITQAALGTRALETRAELGKFWAAPQKSTIPFRGLDAMASAAQARAASTTIDETEIEADLEGDTAFLNALATLPDLPVATRSRFSNGIMLERRSAFSEMASSEFSMKPSGRGFVELIAVAKYLARVLRGVLGRYSSGRDHGFYATCVEELVRGFKLGGSALNEWGKALEWNRMKQDTVDAFGPDPDIHAGTALLARLQGALANGLQLNRITLVGHSTGAIYIANWLATSARYLPLGLKQDIIFLAPAITYDEFAAILRVHGSRVGRFRMFAMKDELERDDQVWGQDEELKGAEDWRRFVYPSSLLYLVSGILESARDANGRLVDQPDMPLVGMERFFANSKIYPDAQFEGIKHVRAWLSTCVDSIVWSKSTGNQVGLNCDSIDHGAFDDNALTIESLHRVIEGGF
jgi:pimeloyl-ACP methyl ester carboxylesterase